jgi:hypothetical protein
MSQKVLDGKLFKAVIITLVAILFSNVLLPTVNVFAAEEGDIYQKLDQIDQEEFELVLNQITEYSEYDYETGKWVLSYEIVKNGLFTEEQYNRAEESGEEWLKVEALAEEGTGNEDIITTFALPVLLVLAIKAVGVIAGTAVVTEITTAFTKWGMSSGCKKFKKYGAIKSFCKANGYL